jgi:16S rRNA (guanine966-N2)-methyltransferase
MSRQRLRIIGGAWRSRQIEFPDVDGIRPTPDRVRETLFNWLQGHTHGARCLEPFSGSGILSFEACSRGASYCLALDQSRAAVSAITKSLQKWQIDAGQFHCEVADARSWLQHYQGQTFDLIFLDPPFADDDISEILTQCASMRLLAEHGFIYVETPKQIGAAELPAALEIYRQKQAGAVHYCLLRRAET